jgi:hypothetical protein
VRAPAMAHFGAFKARSVQLTLFVSLQAVLSLAVGLPVTEGASLMVPHDFFCQICGKTVHLRNCNFDEQGTTVHGSCYTAKVLAADSRKKQSQSAHGIRQPANNQEALIEI